MPSEALKKAKGISIDEHGLPRLPDGRRWVQVIHAPKFLETASHLVPVFGLLTFFYTSDHFRKFAIWNIVAHLIVFIPTVHIPAFFTEKFSWIDLSWPLGLLSLGLLVWCLGTSPLSIRAFVGFQYFMIGGRMALWILVNWKIVVKGRELPRYQYRRLVWEEKPFFFGLVSNTTISMQIEICEQWIWNVSWLCMPAMLHAQDTQASWSPLVIVGFAIWAISFYLETLGDKQKFAWVNKKMKEGEIAGLGRKGGKVCDAGLWRYTRHPNYFFQWAGWVGIVLSCIPALLRLQGQVSQVAWISFAVILFYVPVGSYLMMVYYTGSIPAEVYTVQTRTEYKEYQKTTNMFFPGPPRTHNA